MRRGGVTQCEETNAIEVLMSFCVRIDPLEAVSFDLRDVQQCREGIANDPQISPAVKQALLSLSDAEFSGLPWNNPVGVAEFAALDPGDVGPMETSPSFTAAPESTKRSE